MWRVSQASFCSSVKTRCYSPSARLLVPNRSKNATVKVDEVLELQKKDKPVDASKNSSPAAAATATGVAKDLTFADIARAHRAIRTGIRRTPLVKSHYLSDIFGCNIHFKMDFLQRTGSFKERGARNAILDYKKQQGKTDSKLKGVIAGSAGNHALALAFQGQELNVPVTVVMPTVAPLAKVEGCRTFGAEVIIHGEHIGESKLEAERLCLERGLQYVNGYDDHAIIAGAGTMGIEIMEDLPETEVIIVPVGGAGLIAGVATALKTLNPGVHVVGVEPAFAPSFSAALAAGESCTIDIVPTLADGLAVPKVGPFAFQVAKDVIDRCVTISEKTIALAVLRLIENEKMVVEGGGASGLAALVEEPTQTWIRSDLPQNEAKQSLREYIKGKTVVIPLCGGNIDSTVLGRVLERGLAADHRLVRFVATVSDRPGGIAKLTKLLSSLGVSIKDIYHERAWLHTSVDKVQIKCVVETTNAEHAELLRKTLIREGYPLVWGSSANEGIETGSSYL